MQSPNDRTPDLRAIFRFQTDIQAKGTFKPGDPIQLSVNVQAKLATQNATIRFFLPEIHALKQKKVGRPAVIPVGVPLVPQASWRQGLAQGQVFTRQQTVTVENSGYYHVLVSVQDKGGKKFTKDGMPIKNTVWNDTWLWISKNGGEVTKKLDRSLFPKDARPQPGPITRKSKLPSIRLAPEGKTVNSTSGSVTIATTYLNQTSSVVEPVKDAKIAYFIYNASDQQINSGFLQTDSQGEITYPCQQDGYSYEAIMYTTNDNLTVRDGAPNLSNPPSSLAGVIAGDFSSDCGHSVTMQTDNIMSHEFMTMSEVRANSSSFFLKTRDPITVFLSPDTDNSYYLGGSYDYIVIMNQGQGSTQVGGIFGDFTSAHEYGHALQEKTLGGIHGSLCPQSGHYVFLPYNFGCAYNEGFADYHAEAVGFPYFYFESNTYVNNGEDGSIIEGAVAAFLYDLTDPANESFDNTAYSGGYVGNVIKNCRVVVNGNSKHPDGIDHLIACLQGTVPNYASHFPTRNTFPTSWSGVPIRPIDWNATDVYTLWYKDLYNESYSAPPPPPSAPQNLTITNRTGPPPPYGDPPHLAWNAVSGANEYDLYRCVSLSGNTCGSYSGDYGPMNDVVPTSFTDNETTIENPFTYPNCAQVGYYVTAANTGGESAPSNIVTLNCVDPPDHPHIVTNEL